MCLYRALEKAEEYRFYYFPFDEPINEIEFTLSEIHFFSNTNENSSMVYLYDKYYASLELDEFILYKEMKVLDAVEEHTKFLEQCKEVIEIYNK